MTLEEYGAEWKYRYEERLGMLCGSAEPTEEQEQIARDEANAEIDQLSNQ